MQNAHNYSKLPQVILFMKLSIHLLKWFLIIFFFLSQAADAKEILVKNSKELQRALKNLEPGLTVLIAPGNYTGDISLKNVIGKDENRITFKGFDSVNPPVFTGGMVAFHLADCSYITLRHISVVELTI